MIYFTATELEIKENKVQVATLKTVMGQDCRSVLAGLKVCVPEGQVLTCQMILDALEKHFVAKRNVLYERFMFNAAEQQPHETVTQFLERLRQLASTCKFRYTALEEEMIRDRLVMGSRDQGARVRLFREEECTLNKAFDTLKISEATTHQLKMMTNGEQSLQEVNFVKIKPAKNQGRHQQKLKGKWKGRPDSSKNSAKNSNACKYCVLKHKKSRDNCPAYGKECSKCKRKHHFAKVCKTTSEQVHAGDDVAELSSEEDSTFTLEEVKLLSDTQEKNIFVRVEVGDRNDKKINDPTPTTCLHRLMG
nr:uncharacterized protein LOC129281420 [Lytechinus pictus]